MASIKAYTFTVIVCFNVIDLYKVVILFIISSAYVCINRVILCSFCQAIYFVQAMANANYMYSLIGLSSKIKSLIVRFTVFSQLMEIYFLCVSTYINTHTYAYNTSEFNFLNVAKYNKRSSIMESKT